MLSLMKLKARSLSHLFCFDKESVRIIREAKQAGNSVTAKVTPRLLLLSGKDIPSDSSIYKTNPLLRRKKDREALILGLLDGTIDRIATDYASHTKWWNVRESIRYYRK